MNSTKWPSLTEFAKFLGREGICRVEEGERGLEVQWVDDSPEAVKRREDVKRKERLMKGDEDLEARMLERQIRQAREAAERAGKLEEKRPKEVDVEVEVEPVKVSLSLGAKAAPKKAEPAKEQAENAPVEISTFSSNTTQTNAEPSPAKPTTEEEQDNTEDAPPAPAPSAPLKMGISLGGGSKPKPTNPLIKKSSNPFSKKKESAVATAEPEKKMSNAERIMREEMERKRKAEERGGGFKKQRV